MVGLVMVVASAAQAELKWLTDFEEGKKAAADSGKILLVNFTGPEWGRQLEQEVFSKKAFGAAAEKYVLVELDFPEEDGVIAQEELEKKCSSCPEA